MLFKSPIFFSFLKKNIYMLNRLNFYLKSFVSLIFLLNSILFRKLIKFLNFQKFFFYPRSIYNLSKQFTINKKVKLQKFKNFINYNPKDHFKKILKIKIFDKHIEVKSDFSWKINSNDSEMICALGRWHWLIDNDFEKQNFVRYEDGILLVRSWILNCSNDKMSNNPYEISERITNFIYFLIFHKKTSIEVPQDIKNYLDEITFILANNIEFNNEDLSGNHIINNARSLIIFGYFFNSDQHFNLGKELLSYMLPKLIYDKLFLRESSSHYQYLFTSWIFEIYIISKEKNDTKLELSLENCLSNLINGCLFFKTGKDDEYVLIGDISPDKNPKWLENITSIFLTLSKKKDVNKFDTGWASMISNIFDLNKYKFNFSEIKFDDLCFYKEAGYLKLKKFKWLIFKHIEKNTNFNMASHAHHDFLSIIVYYDNNEVLIDTGRLDYTDTIMGNYGKTAKAHNVITIDDNPASLSKSDRHIPKAFKKREYDITFRNEKNFFEIDLIHNGFQRFNRKIEKHRRTIIIEKELISISDSIYGKGNIKLNSYFHFPKLFKINDKVENNSKENYIDFVYSAENKDSNSYFKLEEYSGSSDPFLGWRFQNYGEKLLARTKVLHGNFEIPKRFSYKLIIKSRAL